MDMLLDSLVYLLVACHAISIVYLFFADYVRLRYPALTRTATMTATIVAVPWLIYALFFIAYRVNCPRSELWFPAPVQCALDLMWLLYVGLGVFLVAFVWASSLCWHLLKAIRNPHTPRPVH
jgi:hypothetical protein